MSLEPASGMEATGLPASLQQRISTMARQLCRYLRLPSTEQEDIEQELWLAVWQAYRQYDPARGPLAALLARTIRHAAISILRRRKRGKYVSHHSLDTHPPSLADNRRAALLFRDPWAQWEIREAVQQVLQQLPERLRDICIRLMTADVARVARDLGLSPHQVRQAIREARPYFVAAGLDPMSRRHAR